MPVDSPPSKQQLPADFANKFPAHGFFEGGVVGGVVGGGLREGAVSAG